MKKILLVLTTSSLLVSSVSTTVALSVAYNNSYSSAERKMIEAYSQTAAYAMRSAVLFDINQITTSWASRFARNQRIKSVLPNLEVSKIIGDDQLPSAENQMDELYWATFGIDDYNFTDDRAMETLAGTNLHDQLANPKKVFSTVAPDSGNILGTLRLVSGLLNTYLGNGFSANTGSTIAGILDQDVVKDLLYHPKETDLEKREPAKGIFEQINEYLTIKSDESNSSPILEVINSLTEKNVAVNDQTFSEVLSTDANLFFKALLIFIYKQTIENDTDVNYSEIFFGRLAGNSDSRLISTEDDQTNYTIRGVAYVLKFLNSLSRYIAQFDQYKKNDYSGPTRLFDPNKSDQTVIREILNKKYKTDDDTDLTWFKVQNADNSFSYYSVINLENFIADLQYYLVPDEKNDPNGINLRKLFLMFLENGDNGVANPLSSLIIKNGLGKILTDFIFNLIGVNDEKINDNALLQQIKIFINSDADNIRDLFSDLVYTFVLKIIKNENLTSMINLLKGILGIIDLDGMDPKIKVAIDELFNFFETSQGKVYLAAPFNALYRGNLIPDILSIIGPAFGEDTDLTPYKKLTNLKALVTLDLTTLLGIFGVKEDSLPDILYGFKSISIGDLLNRLGSFYKTDPLSKETTYNNYLLNTQVFEELFNSLSSVKSWVFNKDNEQISLLLPLYYSILGSNRILDEEEELDKPIIDYLKDIKIQNPNYLDNNGSPITFTILEQSDSTNPRFYRVARNTFEVLLGTDPTDSSKFIKDTTFYHLSRLYGDNYSKEERDLNLKLVPKTDENVRRFKDGFGSMFRGASSIFNSILPEFNKIAVESIDQLIDDKYSKYFNNNNFKIENLTATGFSLSQPTIEQKLEFQLTYRNPDDDKEYIYDVVLTKGNTTSKRGFIVRKFLRHK